MRKLMFVAFYLLVSPIVFAQQSDKPTSAFTITGEVKSPMTIQATDLIKWNSVLIGDVTITNHLGEKKVRARD